MNVDTGVKQTADSNQSGVYRFSSLAPGNYTVTATVAGLLAGTVSFNLATAQTRDVPLNLEVAAGAVDRDGHRTGSLARHFRQPV